ncbi:MAG TPA: DUF2795 domain-containing protein [Solirubrobacteraceae bacterium]|nr:DUF2795 domain-containing protein [Solirubrobacteraceae bacterium]
MHGVTWPVSKEVLLERMQRNGAPEDVLQALRAADHPRFVSPTDVHMILREIA